MQNLWPTLQRQYSFGVKTKMNVLSFMENFVQTAISQNNTDIVNYIYLIPCCSKYLNGIRINILHINLQDEYS